MSLGKYVWSSEGLHLRGKVLNFLELLTLKVQVLLSLDVVNYLPTDSVALQKFEYF